MRDLLLFLEAYARLIGHDLFLSKNGLAALHGAIKRYPLRSRRRQSISIEHMSYLVDLACAFYPKRAMCLQRSAVLVKMLRRHGVPALLVIGAQKLPFRAHAWVEVEGKIINDRLALRETFLVMEVC
ncbi:lasso peptide biosynthesis B2 protein [Acidicapsa dinghuensis]|uniref:Lasso peptide biosynthesis B2 protein n=1 Tax=Acidicapsa dinghuensis TaxID=2218256 RepID=A0ABW1EE99_9BACT